MKYTIIDKNNYWSNRKQYIDMINELFKDDTNKIANLEEITKHLDFIFSQENNDAFLIFNICDDKLNCMVNFFEYNNILKDWCLFSVFTRKDERRKGLAKNILKKGIEMVSKRDGRRIISGIEYDNISSQELHKKLKFVYEGKKWDDYGDGFPQSHIGFVYYLDKDSG